VAAFKLNKKIEKRKLRGYQLKKPKKDYKKMKLIMKWRKEVDTASHLIFELLCLT